MDTIITDSIATANMSSNANPFNWLNITLLILNVILVLIIIAQTMMHKASRSKQYQAEQAIINQPTDWSNTMQVFKAQELYNKLKAVCHPDRFTDTEQNQIANHLFQQITENKTNYNRLVELQKEAEHKLNIKI
ncbi:MAG: hypothetical protein IJS05_06120 [Paludibacteraceae bacterium]|nr:hypothetical protein [Paludibacteraceae bacterium]